MLPDGSEPAELVEMLGPWVQDCVRLLDGNGAFIHFRYGDVLSDQPDVDMQIFDIVRAEWNRMRNEESEKKWRETRSK